MIESGKNFDNIVEKLTVLRREIEVKSNLGLLDINKHCENFIKRLLNLTYNYNLENLNKAVANFPGLDIGDKGKGIAYQITATRKSDKVDDTLTTCLRYGHYKTFPGINVFILTSKQGSYTIKTITDPHFTFDPQKNIVDFDGLIKDIQHVDLDKLKSISDYINSELPYTIAALNEAPEKEIEKESKILTPEMVLQKTGMTTYCHWKSKISILDQSLSVPEIHTKLNQFLTPVAKRVTHLPILNPTLMRNSGTSEILYAQDTIPSGVRNMFSGHSLSIKPSAITLEYTDYSDHELLTNLLKEMVGLLTIILFFSAHSKTASFKILIEIKYETNTDLIFHSDRSLIKDTPIYNTYKLDNRNFKFTDTLSDVLTPTIANLFQNILYGFIAKGPGFLMDPFVSKDPFLTIDITPTEFVIENIKKSLLT
ncbi:MAG TPA: SMEK domain-containing protein [Chitinophagaceae bacterium]|nr:SMEK domain-containing protein [Chitinophagaceae bacterium]